MGELIQIDHVVVTENIVVVMGQSSALDPTTRILVSEVHGNAISHGVMPFPEKKMIKDFLFSRRNYGYREVAGYSEKSPRAEEIF